MLWIKALHLIAVICWFAGLFYLPRLFVYHAMAQDKVSLDRFVIMERKLYKGIMLPAMIATWVLGLYLLVSGWDFYKTQGWMHVKLTLVFFLTGYHHACGKFLRDFRDGNNKKSHVFYRWFNEVPVVFLIAIVILVIVRPF